MEGAHLWLCVYRRYLCVYMCVVCVCLCVCVLSYSDTGHVFMTSRAHTLHRQTPPQMQKLMSTSRNSTHVSQTYTHTHTHTHTHIHTHTHTLYYITNYHFSY